MPTYSIGFPPTDATKLQDLQSIFGVLPDNTSKLIAPKDVRDSVYTLWENIIYKPTNAGGPEYIGIDQDTVTQKVYFGKKKVGGQFVMNNSLLATDVDFFFFNTKTASSPNYDTKIAFLAGTSSYMISGNLAAPYIQSRVVNNGGSFSKTIDFEIINPSYFVSGTSNEGGNINILSENGSVVINGIRFPEAATNLLGIQNDYVLKYKWIAGTPYAVWEAPVTASVTSIISSGPVVIQGNPVTVNGFPLEFSDSTPTPTAFGGILGGSTFSNVPVVEMIRRMLYGYIAPRITTFLTSTILELGDAVAITNLKMNWQITKNSTYSILPAAMTGANSGPLPGLITADGATSGQINITIPNFGTYTFLTTTTWAEFGWTLSITDTFPTTRQSSNTMKLVTPWYYGSSTFAYTQSNIVSILGTQSTSVVNKLTPILAEPATTTASIHNKTVPLSTYFGSGQNQGYVYFGYPAEFPDLAEIIDQNGFDVTSTFYKFTVSGLNSPNPGRWGNKTYKFYIYVGSGPSASTPILTTITSGAPYYGNYQFKFS